MTKAEEKRREDKYLPNKVIVLKPTPRKGQMVDDPKHKMYFMLDEATMEWKLPISKKTGSLYDLFESPEEREFFEKKIGADLNVYKKSNNYWWDFKIRVTKTPDLLENGIKFNLNDPVQALKVKVLKLQEDIAPSWERRKKRPKYKWVLVDESREIVDKASKADLLSEAYVHYSKMKDDDEALVNFLTVYGATKNLHAAVPKNAKKAFLRSEVSKIIDNDLKGYLAVAQSEDYEYKVLVNEAVKAGAIERYRNKYSLPGGDPIDPIDQGYDATVKALKAWSDPEDDNYEKYMVIKARIENAK